jgi:hypothetical protein
MGSLGGGRKALADRGGLRNPPAFAAGKLVSGPALPHVPGRTIFQG